MSDESSASEQPLEVSARPVQKLRGPRAELVLLLQDLRIRNVSEEKLSRVLQLVNEITREDHRTIAVLIRSRVLTLNDVEELPSLPDALEALATRIERMGG